MVAQWRPLEEPTAFISTFRTWRRALKLGDMEEKSQMQVDVYGTQTFISPSSQVYVSFHVILTITLLTHVFAMSQRKADDAIRDPSMECMAAESPLMPEQ